MNVLDTLMAPVETAISWILVHAVQLLGLVGLEPTRGVTWLAAVSLLVVLVRLALIPLTIRQIRMARATAAMAPAMHALQTRYRGRTDPESRRHMAEESAALRREHGASLLGCLPILLQAPIFYALFHVLRAVSQDHAVGHLDQELVDQASSATFSGAHLADTVLAAQTGTGHVVAVVVVAASAVATLVTQRRQQRLNTPLQDPAGPAAAFSRSAVYLAPATLVLSGLWLPLGVLTYWLVSNLWTLGQQLVVIRYLPTPGTPAHRRYTARLLTAGGATPGGATPDVGPSDSRPPARTQRDQPVRRTRARRRR